MHIFAEHNLAHPLPDASQCRYGIRVHLRSSDPFRNLLGDDWSKEHWFTTAQERDEQLVQMSKRYLYSRSGDEPALNYEKIER